VEQDKEDRAMFWTGFFMGASTAWILGVILMIGKM
jgi:hypothetical protein